MVQHCMDGVSEDVTFSQDLRDRAEPAGEVECEGQRNGSCEVPEAGVNLASRRTRRATFFSPGLCRSLAV